MSYRPFVALAVLGAACAPTPDTTTPAAPQDVVYTADDYAFSGPDTVAPGVTALRMINRGTEPHHLILARLENGMTMDSLAAAMTVNPHVPPAWLHFVGAASTVFTADSAGSIMDLAPGEYVAICFLPSPADGKTHAQKGMVRPLVVTGPRHEAPLPVATDLRMSDFAFQMPTLGAGDHTFRVINDGAQPHEVVLMRLADGATLEQLAAAFAPGASAPPPGVPLGGSGALSAGAENYWTVHLTPGRYALICVIPDPASGAPHIAMGMATEFSIQ